MEVSDIRMIVKAKKEQMQKHKYDHQKGCAICHQIEMHGKNEQYCPEDEGLKYWLNCLNWMIDQIG